MSEELSNALALLANQLGITTAQLWDWLQGSGVQAYASAKVATMAVGVVAFLAFELAIAVASVTAHRLHVRAEKENRYYDGEWLVILITLLVIAAVVFVPLAIDVSNLIGWLVSPEGMVLSMIVGDA